MYYSGKEKMVVDQKIKESEFFLDKITEATTREDFIPNLSAFLSAARSIPDYLLEDYNSKLGLKIPLTRKLSIEAFGKRTNSQKNKIAKIFITAYKKQLGELRKDPIAKLLTEKRNISVHRSEVPVQGRIKRQLHETVSINDSVGVEVRDKDGNIKMTSKPARPASKPRVLTDEESTPPDSVKWYFVDYQNDDVVITCQKFLSLLRSFVVAVEENT
jgi:hypothetical protein